MNKVCFNHLFCADDLCLLAPCATALQQLADVCVLYGVQNDIVFNPLKSQYVVFEPPSYRTPIPSVFINNDIVPRVNAAKYLGVLLTSNMSDNDEILKQVRGLYARCNTVLRKFRNCSMPVKAKLFQSFCTNFYCMPLWCRFNQNVVQRLKVAYNNVFRSLFTYDRRSSASQMFVFNNVPNFSVLLRKSVFSFMNRIFNSSNELVFTLASNSRILTNELFNHWWNSLYMHV